jgi:phospholipid-translocating ATPase
VKDVQSFLGLTGYYRRFIKDYAKIAESLLKQLRCSEKYNRQLQWSKECNIPFETLKNELTKAPMMNTPNFEQPFIVELDACEYGLGAILT